MRLQVDDVHAQGIKHGYTIKPKGGGGERENNLLATHKEQHRFSGGGGGGGVGAVKQCRYWQDLKIRRESLCVGRQGNGAKAHRLEAAQMARTSFA